MDHPFPFSDAGMRLEWLGATPDGRTGDRVRRRSEGVVSRRMAMFLIGLIVLGAAGVLYAKHSRRDGDELFTSAQEASRRGQYADAAHYYHLVATQYPNHADADDALYQLGYVYRNYLNDSERALTEYERLVKLYPRSPWVRYALREIGDLYRADGHFDQALAVYESIIAQFGANHPDIHADTALQIARTRYDMREAAAATAACQEILGLNGAHEAQLAEALFMMARIAVELEDRPGQAIEYLQTVVASFPGSAYHDEAAKELAYLRQRMAANVSGSQTHGAEAAATAGSGAGPSPDAVVAEVPTAIPGGVSDDGLFACLRVLCAAHGQVISEAKLAGFSAYPFAFFYSREQRLGGSRVVLNDPVKTAVQRAGVEGCKLVAERSEDAAIARLKSFIASGTPVLVPLTLGGRPTWKIVRGYDSSRGEVYLYSASGRYQAVGGAEFRAAWRSKSRPDIAVKGARFSGLPLYAIEGPKRPTDVASAVTDSVRDAVELLRGTVSVGGYSSGAEAFALLAEDMAGLADSSLSDSDLRELGEWCGRELPELVGRRELAATHLATWRDSVFGGGENGEAIDEAIRLLRQSAVMLAELASAFRRAQDGTGPTETGGSPYDIALRLSELDSRAAEALEAAL